MTEQTANTVFEINDLTVAYGFRRAVNGLSLTLQKGQCLGLLGVNGAGKTSTIGALLAMLRPRHGSVRVFGQKPGTRRILSRIGFAPEDGAPPEYLTAREYLSFVGSFRIKNRSQREQEVAKLLEWFELVPSKKIRDFSKGMRRRLILAQAFIGEPELLILDEPLNGLDPLIIIKLRQKLDEYLKSGRSVLYSSHILNEIERTCSHVAMLSEGKLVCSATVPELLSEFGSVEQAFAKKVGGAVA